MHIRTITYSKHTVTLSGSQRRAARENHIESQESSLYDDAVELRRKVVGYCRVSTEQQAEGGISLDAQRHQIINYCNRSDLDLIDVIVDGGQSGKDLDRPGFKKVIEILESGRAYGLVIAKLDRLSRSIVDICKLVDKYFANQRFSLLSASENLDTLSPTGRLHLYLISVFAQIERESIVERVTSSIRHYQAQGGKVGCAPYGWRYSDRLDSRGNRILEEDPRQQAAIRRMCELHDAGKTVREIIAILTEEGYPPQRDGKWTFNSAWRVLIRCGKHIPRQRSRIEQQRNLAEVGKRALELRSDGKTYPEIARALNHEGIRLEGRDKQWQASTVADLVDRTATRDTTTAYGLACQLRTQGRSLRDIGRALLAEGFRPTRGEYWHAATVRNLLLTRGGVTV
ncbi:MAG: recombinase family protein [Polyangia bacterium]